MNFKMPKFSDALFGGFFLGLVLLGLVVVFFLSAKAERIRPEDISSISRRYQSYQDCARVPYTHGNPSQIDRVDFINVSVISGSVSNQQSSYVYRNATFIIYTDLIF